MKERPTKLENLFEVMENAVQNEAYALNELAKIMDKGAYYEALRL